jgi:hypothetical protein
MDGAFRKAFEQQKKSSNGMRETALELRQRASRMRDSDDREVILRLAAEFECRATDAERRRSLRQDQPNRK